MSIAEKLTTVAENQQKVYDAGHNKAVELYCPEFMESGASVVCNPVGNYPLGVISYINPIQSGSGEPSPTNVRPITGHTAVTVYIQNENGMVEQTAQLEQNVYAGSFDWSTGLLTLTHKMQTFTGEEPNWVKHSDWAVLNHTYLEDSKQGTATLYGYCSHVGTASNGSIDYKYIRKANTTRGYEILPLDWGLPDNEIATWTNYLKEQMLNGTPVQVLYQLEVPITVQLTPQEILALSGTNTIRSDTGNTTVKGKRDPLDKFTPLVQTIPLSDLLFGYGVGVTKNAVNGFYVSSNSGRTICPYFIPIDAGGTYRFDWKGDSSVKIGAEAYNTTTTHRVALESGISNVDMHDYGWGTSGGESYIITIPETINGKPADSIRVMFNAGSGVTGDITITKIK